MARKSGLGKGLDALIPGNVSLEAQTGAAYIEIAKIKPNPRQPRHHILDEDLEELAASILEHGILQPLIVARDEENDRYLLIAGERRMEAARKAGMRSVPVLIRQVSDQQMLELALIENLQRADLTPLETANAYRHLHEEFKLSHDEIAARVSKSRVSVTNTLRLLNLPEAVQKALAEGAISEGHARALLGLNNPQAQIAALNSIIKNEMTVRQTEELVRRLGGAKMPHKNTPPQSPEIRSLEERLRSALGTRVKLRHSGKSGSLTLYYYSEEELNALVERILQD